MANILFNMSECRSIEGHRSGWGFVMDALRPLHSKRHGIFVDGFLEESHSWHYYDNKKKGRIPHTEPWVGFIHNPQNSPEWFDHYNSPQKVLTRDCTLESLKLCKSIICMSKYHEDWTRDFLSSLGFDIPVFSVKHPTEIPARKWCYHSFVSKKRNHRTVAQIGFWLRKMTSIVFLETEYKRVWLPGQEYAKEMFEIEKRMLQHPLTIFDNWPGFKILDHLSNDDYDKLLSECIVFIELYDSSANNAVIECIARNTPIIVNRLPATEEYLGVNYPLYFETLEEASEILLNEHLILQAHKYLANMDKDFLRQDTFREEVVKNLTGIL